MQLDAQLYLGASPQHLDCNVAAYALTASDWLPGALPQVETGRIEVPTLHRHHPIFTPPNLIRKTLSSIQELLYYLG